MVYFTVHQAPPMPAKAAVQAAPLAAWALHLKSTPLRAGFGIGFCILFAFIGTFTFVNFVLTRAPLSLGSMQLGFVYFVFLPSIFTTPLAGRTVQLIGTRQALWIGLATAGMALPLLVTPYLPAVLLGIGGTIYKIISPDGWVAQAFGRSLSAGAAALGSLLMVVALAWFSRASSPRRRTQFADIAVYGFAAAGLLYVVQLWVRGSF